MSSLIFRIRIRIHVCSRGFSGTWEPRMHYSQKKNEIDQKIVKKIYIQVTIIWAFHCYKDHKFSRGSSSFWLIRKYWQAYSVTCFWQKAFFESKSEEPFKRIFFHCYSRAQFIQWLGTIKDYPKPFDMTFGKIPELFDVNVDDLFNEGNNLRIYWSEETADGRR